MMHGWRKVAAWGTGESAGQFVRPRWKRERWLAAGEHAGSPLRFVAPQPLRFVGGQAMGLLAALSVAMACFFHAVPAGAALRAEAPEATVVEVTDEVLVPDICRFGVNLGDDSWHDGSVLVRERILHGGFEGVIHRHLTFGPGGDAWSYFDWFSPAEWQGLFTGARCRFVTGPRKGTGGIVAGMEEVPCPFHPDGEVKWRYLFHEAGPAPEPNDGLLLERMDESAGYVGQHGRPFWVEAFGDASARTVAGDPPPGSRGRVSLLLDGGTGGSARLVAPAFEARWARPEGEWTLSFWAKGWGDFEVYLGKFGMAPEQGYALQSPSLSSRWQRYQIPFRVEDYPLDLLGVVLSVSNGSVWLDELSFIRTDEGSPETAFREPVVNLLRVLRPGILRHLQIGGSTLHNLLEPRASRKAFGSSRFDPPANGPIWPGHPDQNGRMNVHSYGIHEFLELCEHVGADPWYCTPGTWTPEEMRGLVEYLAAPPDTTYGEVRRLLGRSRPWTDAFDRIHLEIGNEAWNGAYPFQGGGYSQKGEYWNDLFRAAKDSPYHSDRIVLHAGGQAVNVHRNERIAREVPAADALAIAPYLLPELDDSAEAMGDEEFFAWLFGFPWYEAHRGMLAENLRRGEPACPPGPPLSVYEVNYHTTRGDAPAALRNRVATSLGGGVNLAHWMLLMLRYGHARFQNFFNFAQFDYPFNETERVRLWGGVASMKEGEERVRPALLALTMVNRVLFGDMTRVRTGGKSPVWTWENRDSSGNRQSMLVPCIHAYATREDNRRGLVLFNLHASKTLPVRLQPPRRVKEGSGMSRRLEGTGLSADNEPEHEVQVWIEEEPWESPGTESVFFLKPGSLTVLYWEEEP